MIIRLTCFVLLLSSVLGFLPTRLNFDDPDLKSTFCDVTEKTYDLKAISREGIRREIRNLFNEDPPAGSTGFFVPEDATLSEMFHMYYGEDSSATRFYKAVNTIAWANADVDSMESTKYNTSYHFDGENIDAAQSLLSNRHNLIVSSLISNQSYDFARQQIGFSLHAIQDFYSHTNYYELGNDEILENLGLPGYVIPGVAGVDDEVCTACISSSGGCVGNVIDGGKITSGYYEYNVTAAQPFIRDKPAATGKCSFGGTLDTSGSIDPIGGINKASTSSCFSPHFNLHYDVVELASQATQNYLSVIRDTIGNENFRFLFDLYQGSALVIVMDTTGSMGGEIIAVQNQVALIVATAPADLYILVPYGDPWYGPVTRTTDSDTFLQAVNDLAAGGGGDQPEMVWSALQLAISSTPDYSTLYLFTDAGGKDYERMNGDFALAQDKNILCTTVFSYYNDVLDGPPNTDDTDYMRLATVTGGEFLTIDDFSVDNVITIIENGIGSSVVILALRRDMTGDVNFDALVDNTVNSFGITISGFVDSAIIKSPGVLGPSYDLKNLASLEADPSVTINAYSDLVIDVSFDLPNIGNWNIQTSGNNGTYSVTATAGSTLGYLIEFTQLDLRPPRPTYKLINGQPIQDLTYYVEITLVGWIDNGVASVEFMDFVDKHGNVLSSVANAQSVDDEFYVLSDPLPNQNFYVMVQGTLSTGNQFIRLYETLITPSIIGIEVNLTRSVFASPPNTTVEAYFYVYNYGGDDNYTYYAADDKGYVSATSPNTSMIVEEGYQEVIVTITVPADAIPWTESTIVVTASDNDNPLIVNSDTAYFIVLPEERDTTPPTCVENDIPDCIGFQSSATCDESSWTVSATLQDTDSGLATIYIQPANNDTDFDSGNFTSGTVRPVEVSVTSSCCVRELDIIGVDEQGNIGVCSYEIGELDGVLTFLAIDEGSTWVYLQWTVDYVRFDLYKYTLVTDFAFSNDVACFNTICYFNSTNLEPCSPHHFQLTPYFDSFNNFTLVPGATAETNDDTLDQEPHAPINGMGTNATANTVLVSWDAPSDDRCIVLYEVCYDTAGTRNSSVTTICVTTPDTSITLTGVEPCSLYDISVTSITESGLSSDALMINVPTGDAVPGEPQNFIAYNLTADSASLTWDAPLINPQCVSNYEVTWYESGEASAEARVSAAMATTKDNVETYGEFTAIVSPLSPCANYTFTVYAVSFGGLAGPEAFTYGETGETAPSDPTNLVVVATGTTSLNASWDDGGGTCVGFYEICIDDPYTLHTTCTFVNGTSYEMTGLVPCTGYTVTILAFSPGGLTSSVQFAIGVTDDEAPGPPLNLNVTAVTSSSVTIEYDNPDVNPQCVDEYLTDFIDLDANQAPANGQEEFYGVAAPRIADNSNTQTGIESCTDLYIMVRAVSPRGLASEWSNATTSTLEALPSNPQNLGVVLVTADSILIRWFAPLSNNRCASTYRVVWTDSLGYTNSGTLDVLYKEQYEFQYTLTGLSGCETYNIGVSGLTDSALQGPSTYTTGTTTC